MKKQYKGKSAKQLLESTESLANVRSLMSHQEFISYLNRIVAEYKQVGNTSAKADFTIKDLESKNLINE